MESVALIRTQSYLGEQSIAPYHSSSKEAGSHIDLAFTLSARSHKFLVALQFSSADLEPVSISTILDGCPHLFRGKEGI